MAQRLNFAQLSAYPILDATTSIFVDASETGYDAVL